jgi:hypothetical protein
VRRLQKRAADAEARAAGAQKDFEDVKGALKNLQEQVRSLRGGSKNDSGPTSSNASTVSRTEQYVLDATNSVKDTVNETFERILENQANLTTTTEKMTKLAMEGHNRRIKTQCPAPDKFMGNEGDTSESFLEMFKEWRSSQQLTEKAAIIALHKNVGPKVQTVLKNLPDDKKWLISENCRVIEARWSDSKAREANRKNFPRRVQSEKESLEEFMDELKSVRRLGWRQESEDSAADALRSQFWDGLSSTQVKNQMLNALQSQDWYDMTIEEVLKNAIRAKLIVDKRREDKQSHPERTGRPERAYATAERPSKDFASGKCYGCGEAGHMIRECKNPHLMKDKKYVKMVASLTAQENSDESDSEDERDPRDRKNTMKQLKGYVNSTLCKKLDRQHDEVCAMVKKSVICHRCGEPGHYANECHSERTPPAAARPNYPNAVVPANHHQNTMESMSNRLAAMEALLSRAYMANSSLPQYDDTAPMPGQLALPAPPAKNHVGDHPKKQMYPPGSHQRRGNYDKPGQQVKQVEDAAEDEAAGFSFQKN